jgi:uncharacterized membrane protein (UPF0127 family)
MRRWLALLVLFVACPAFSAGPQDLTIDTAKGPAHFTVELATTPAQRELGLMFRQALPPDAGMLFIYPDEESVAFWMKNTLIPLDMLFIGADGHIRRIAERAVPLSETPIPSVDPVEAVLEVNGGTVERLGIRQGDLVHNETFGNAD